MQVNLTSIPVQPWFELEDFMNFAHETRLANEAVENFARLWEDWQGKLQAVGIKSGSDSWLAIWLPEEVEQQIDEAWSKSPGEGFLINNLAQYLCMAAIGEILPQVADLGCAPTPQSSASLNAALAELGVVTFDGKPLRRFMVLTYHPFRGGCEVCSLHDNCPKISRADFASITLPGHVPGEES